MNNRWGRQGLGRTDGPHVLGRPDNWASDEVMQNRWPAGKSGCAPALVFVVALLLMVLASTGGEGGVLAALARLFA